MAGRPLLLYNGRMAVNQYVKSATGYTYVGKDGTPVENYSKSRPARFIKDSVGFRYRNLDGTYSRKTWQCIKGSWYYFYSSGYMARRTKLGMYYVGTNGKMVTNRWIKIGNYKYYYGADGRMTKKYGSSPLHRFLRQYHCRYQLNHGIKTPAAEIRSGVFLSLISIFQAPASCTSPVLLRKLPEKSTAMARSMILFLLSPFVIVNGHGIFNGIEHFMCVVIRS